MKCCDCGKEMRKRSGYTLMDHNVGFIETDGEYWECTNPDCGCKLVPAETVQKVDVIREDRIGKMLWAIAEDAKGFAEKFICVKDVAKILGVTRQAVEKSVFVKALTYNIVVGHVRYWLKESVELYKKTGNGKFQLTGKTSSPDHQIRRFVVKSVEEISFKNSTRDEFIIEYPKIETTLRTTEKTCKSLQTSPKRASSRKRGTRLSSSICSISPRTQRKQYLQLRPATGSMG